MNKTTLDTAIFEMKAQVIEWRRKLHRHPELSYEEVKTSQFIFDTLKSFGNLEVERPTKTSVLAKLKGKNPGKTLAMRADIDALPIKEENDFEFKSENENVMHACGHDGHTAMMLGAAKILSEQKDAINGEIRFIFEHAEESFPGGAYELIQAGVLDGVDHIIGAHLMSTLDFGKIGITYGHMMAAADGFWITIKGKGGHGGLPHATVDSIVVGAQVVNNLQQIVSRNVDPLDSVVLSIGNFVAEGAGNVIADKVEMNGIVRSFDPKYREIIPKRIEEVLKGITEAHGASYTLDYQHGFPSLYNDTEVTKRVEDAIREHFTADTLIKLPPIMGAESFAYYSQKVPGTYVHIGARNEAEGIVYPHHHPKFTFDEAALEYGMKIFVHSAFKFLA